MNIYQWLAQFDDRSLSDEDWISRMKMAVEDYNVKFHEPLPVKETIMAYLKKDSIIRNAGASRRLLKRLDRDING